MTHRHRRPGSWLSFVPAAPELTWPKALAAQTPINLFDDAPRLGDGLVRIGTAWNLRHINLESDAEDYRIRTEDRREPEQ